MSERLLQNTLEAPKFGNQSSDMASDNARNRAAIVAGNVFTPSPVSLKSQGFNWLYLVYGG